MFVERVFAKKGFLSLLLLIIPLESSATQHSSATSFKWTTPSTIPSNPLASAARQLNDRFQFSNLSFGPIFCAQISFLQLCLAPSLVANRRPIDQ